jgi:hypothetical protein
VPPNITASMKSDVSHFTMSRAILWKGLNGCQAWGRLRLMRGEETERHETS